MTRGQRLTAVLVTAALLLLAGRAAAVLYSQQEWYAALGAPSVWSEYLAMSAALYGGGFAIAFLFAWVNVAAVRRSVIALVVPKRVANVEFGEEVPAMRLQLATLGLAAIVAAIGLFALPGWGMLALARAHVVFAEVDPAFGLDLSYWVTWLPLEEAVYRWATVVFAAVAVLVVVLYALTPSLRWGRGGVRTTAYARRHLSVLGAALLLLAAWAFRLDAFSTLVEGSGPAGALTRVDRVWIIPSDVLLSLVTIGCAVVLVVSGWVGQTRTAFATVTFVILATLVTQVLAPIAAARAAAAPGAAAAERPYREMRDDYTGRAFSAEPVPVSAQHVADSAVIANAALIAIPGALPNVVFPGALGTAIVGDPQRLVAAPRLGDGLERFMHAWAEQNPQLLTSDAPGSAAFVAERDVRARVAALAPVFVQSRQIGAVPTARGVMWILDLYVVSESYPLSAPQTVGRTRMTYAHHAGAAYVSGGTGATVIVPDSIPDPVTRAWFEQHPGAYVAPRLPQALVAPLPSTTRTQPGMTAADVAFRSAVARAYQRMRAALDSGNLRAFSAAFDSLGTIVQGHP